MSLPYRLLIGLILLPACCAISQAADGFDKLLTPEESAAQAAGAHATADGKTITFGGDQYLLKNSQSFPGNSTNELREYLRQGEDWDGYRKMVALRMMSKDMKGDAATLANVIIEQTKKDFSDTYIKSVLLEPNHAVIFFIISKDGNVELNFWDFRKTSAGYPSVQFVLRNKAPYDSPAKFKAEQDAHYDAWLAGLATLASRAEQILDATANKAGAIAPDGK